MLVKHFRSRTIAGNWYPLVSIHCHEHAMTDIMVLRRGYAMFFRPSDVRKPCQGRGCSRDCVVKKGMPTKLGRCVIAQNEVTIFSRGCVAEKGRTWNTLILVISISRWNQKHIGSVIWNNESITIH